MCVCVCGSGVGGWVGRIAEVGSRIKRTGRHRPPPPPAVNSYGLTAGLKGSHLHYLSFFFFGGGGAVLVLPVSFCRPRSSAEVSRGARNVLKMNFQGCGKSDFAVIGGHWDVHLWPAINEGRSRKRGTRSHGVANQNKSPFEGALPIGTSTQARTGVRPRVLLRPMTCAQEC